MNNMRRDFIDRNDLINYIKEEFSELIVDDNNVSNTKGGRKEAERRLRDLNPIRYAKTRNYFNGDISQLSPYIRHGILTIAEVRDHALNQVNDPSEAEKFISELGWRDYWQRLYREIGDGIWDDREAYKTGYDAQDYNETLPDDIQNGTTGLACIDAFSNTLKTTGYLHNHARMYLASYIIHHRHIRWQAGAKWFLRHLLDGDPASNNLSWQWIASTFSNKPYYFNRENLEKFTDGIYCKDCPLQRNCPFDASYEQLEHRIFPNKPTNNDIHHKRNH